MFSQVKFPNLISNTLILKTFFKYPIFFALAQYITIYYYDKYLHPKLGITLRFEKIYYL